MCGIVGLIGGGAPRDAQERTIELRRMNDTLRHRGPDDFGEWFEPELDVALAQRRLSIVDLSPLGHQPMISASGRYAITFNGEVYGFATLRRELQGLGFQFKGGSDTEVLLAAIEAFGVAEALKRITGMFAFGLWDRRERELWLGRDRFGEKPMLYAVQNGRLFFGSELRALIAATGFRAEIDRAAIPGYLRFNYFPGTASALKGVKRLAPGHIARIPLSKLTSREISSAADVRTEAYWSAREVFTHARARGATIDFDSAVEELGRRLQDIVARQMIADVPLGAFLSGGVDSSLVVAMMTKVSREKVKTFTIGYSEKAYDESPYAKRVAEHLGTEHYEIPVSSAEALNVAKTIGRLYDEPFADQSQIPTFLVSKAARTKVTVALTGDGGDEIFGGYNRHVWAERVWKAIRRAPQPLRTLVSGSLGVMGQESWDHTGDFLRKTGIRALSHQALGLKIQKLRTCLKASDAQDLYMRLASMWDAPHELVLGAEPDGAHRYFPDVGDDMAQSMMFWDAVTYMPGDILTKVDRASMATSLETRAPFLDHELAAWSWSLPLDYKIRGSTGKLILRSLLAKHVPTEMFERPKQGFGVPVDLWLRGPLKSWAAALLDRDRLRAEGVFDAVRIHAAWDKHQSGAADLSQGLWSILMYQLWSENLNESRVQLAA